MSAISEKIDAIVAEALAKPLKEAGYRKRGRTFHNVGDSVVRVVNVQGSNWNMGDGGQFTINLGVYLPQIAKCLGERELPAGKLPAEYHCTIRERIGLLMPGGQDYWWEIEASSDLSALAKEVQKAWLEYGQPWLHQNWGDLKVARALLARHGHEIEAVAASVILKELDEARKIVFETSTWYRKNRDPSKAEWIESRARKLGVTVG